MFGKGGRDRPYVGACRLALQHVVSRTVLSKAPPWPNRCSLDGWGLAPIARIGMPEGLSRGFRKSTQAFGAAGGLRPSEG